MRDAAYWRKYEQSPKRKAWVARYKAEGKRQAAQARYEGTEKQKATRARSATKRSASRAADRAANPKPPPIGRYQTQRRSQAKAVASGKRAADHLKRRYGVTDEQIAKLQSQKACAICGRTDTKLVTDHKHEPHQVRDRLCRYCNIMIGVLEHSNYQKAVEYLHGWDSVLHNT